MGSRSSRIGDRPAIRRLAARAASDTRFGVTSVKTRSALALLVLLGVVAALRLHHLGKESLWPDEAFSITIARVSVAHIIDETSRDVHPPLYYTLLRYWMLMAGSTEAAARLLSVLLSLGTVVASYFMGLRLVNRRAGLAAAALLTFLPFQVEFSQEARMYSLLALLGTISFRCLVGLFDSPSPRWMVAYALSTAAMLYTQIYGSFVFAGEIACMAWMLVLNRGRLRPEFVRWLGSAIAAAALFIPWMFVLARQASRVQSGFWIPRRPWIAILEPFWTYSGSVALVAVLAPLAALGFVLLVWRSRTSVAAPAAPPPALILGCWLAAPIVIPFVLSQIGSPIFRRVHVPASVLFAILPAPASPFRGTLLPIGLVGLLAYLPINGPDVLPRRGRTTGVRRGAWTLTRRRATCRVLPRLQLLPHDYYKRQRLPRGSVPAYTEPSSANLPPVVQKATGDHRRVWFIVLSYDPGKLLIADAFRQTFTERDHFETTHLDVFLFER